MRNEQLEATVREVVAQKLDPAEHSKRWIEGMTEILDRLDGVPQELLEIQDFDFKMALANDRDWSERVGIPFHKLDQYWDDIRTGYVTYCKETYLQD
jgi:hypothetical protein